MTAKNIDEAVWLVDAHIHLHDETALSVVFHEATRHMMTAANARGSRLDAGVLMMTESAGADVFAAMAADPSICEGWEIVATEEDVSLTALPIPAGDRPPLLLIAGRQIVTAEGLELHALGTRAVIADGATLDATLNTIFDAGALAVLPWGFGKWSGARGQHVRDLITRRSVLLGAGGHHFFLADSGARSTWSQRPALLGIAESTGIPVLAGSDPLPLARDMTKPGRFGFIATPGEQARPFASLQATLGRLGESPEIYGSLEPTGAFIANQIAMQVRKRFR